MSANRQPGKGAWLARAAARCPNAAAAINAVTATTAGRPLDLARSAAEQRVTEDELLAQLADLEARDLIVANADGSIRRWHGHSANRETSTPKARVHRDQSSNI